MAKPAAPHLFEFCENGAKATAWELTQHRATPALFAQHTVRELESWSDNVLESGGRLTQLMRYYPATDHYVPVSWESAFADIGERLRRYDASSAVFYASGRASLETAYMYQLLARLYGTNNLPDCSNMCHETTSVALPESIGVPVGTVILEDFQYADAIFFFGQNVGSNSPRMLHDLQEARQRGVPIVTFNPLHERGLEEFTNPQSPKEMLTGEQTRISTQFHQVKAGGDMAAIMGMCTCSSESGSPAGLPCGRFRNKSHPVTHFSPFGTQSACLDGLLPNPVQIPTPSGIVSHAKCPTHGWYWFCDAIAAKYFLA